MDLYSLDRDFTTKEVIDNFSSLVWTDRYTKPGDFKMTAPATSEIQAKLPEGTFVSIQGTNEVMIVDNVLVEKGVLTVSGQSLLNFLKERVFRINKNSGKTSENYSPSDPNKPVSLTPGQLISRLVLVTAIQGIEKEGYTTEQGGPGGAKERIPNLQLGAIDNSGTFITTTIPYGPLLDPLQQIADTYNVGMSLRLVYANTSGYVLEFVTYQGVDRTTAQTAVDVVRFAPNLDSLANSSELRSMTGYKNVCFAYATAFNFASELAANPGVAGDDSRIGFDRRVLMIQVDDVTPESMGLASGSSTAAVTAYLNQKAKDALANNNYTKVVDGEVVPQSEFKYGKHYFMGDIIELQSETGTPQRARITEYIRSQDNNGERAYPTVTVVD